MWQKCLMIGFITAVAIDDWEHDRGTVGEAV